MNRSKLRSKFLKTRNEESKRRFNRQRNFCVRLLRKTKRRFFWFFVSGNRKFWKTTVTLLGEGFFHKESVILNNDNKTISNKKELAESFNKHFSKLVENLDIDI